MSGERNGVQANVKAVHADTSIKNNSDRKINERCMKRSEIHMLFPIRTKLLEYLLCYRISNISCIEFPASPNYFFHI